MVLTGRPRFGTVFAPSRPIAELPDAARQVESLGLDELWVVEDCFLHGGLTAASAALAVTGHLSVGVGLLPAAVRNPAIVAMELATIAHLYPRRFQVAFGHGVDAWMRQIGARPRDRLVALRDVVAAVHALLHGEAVSVNGRFVKLDDVRLDTPPDDPPAVLIGTTGERGVALAAEVADGLLLPEGSGESTIGWARGVLGAGRRLVAYAWLSVDEDPERARAALLPQVRRWREMGLYPGNYARSGFPEADAVQPADVDRVAIAGTPAECAKALLRFADEGASTIVVVPVAEDPVEQLARFAEDVLPLVLADRMGR
jgi:5,10-methylenetetrahydromethanopterin reductase